MVAAWLLVAPGARAQQAPYLELVETVPDQTGSHWVQVSPGAISLREPQGAYAGQIAWSAPPATMDATGFSITVNVQVQGPAARIQAGGEVGGSGFDIVENPPGILVLAEVGESKSGSATLTVRPRSGLADGSIAELLVGASFGPHVIYRYRVSNTAGGTTGGMPPPLPPQMPAETLEAVLDCPSEIVRSALPSIICNIVITRWRRNTSAPVEVLMPAAIDTFGNHPSGLQVLGAGSHDVFEWDSPYNWSLLVFACPSQQGTGANCYDSATVPDAPASVPIIVRQKGGPDVNLLLTMNVIGRGGTGTGGAGQGTTARIGSAWRAGDFLHIETGALTTGPILLDWLSARWQIEPVAGTPFVRFRNHWKPDHYIHVESGTVAAGPISPDWWSAMWLIEPLEGGRYVRIRNRWRENDYLHIETGTLQAGPIQPGWWSAVWWALQ
ncbi:hypothetical protein D3874_09125 [Oleomonas cavernae]|uniref:Uncharacterized protein n=1 Tax=Oleomonas cavernae TaxID=2320859 RepID=A0A418WAV8_9PROT|nr:hypothetical protein [Oleomonas cavernae]RJF87167.1 hypothetical protein D3874_09125 [Oleomonas cavernae]